MENQTNNIFCGNSKFIKTIIAVLFAALAVYVAVLAVNAIKANKYIGRDVSTQNTISVSGKGEIYVKPDLAVMDFSVLSEAKTVAEAMTDNTKKMNAIADVVKSLGVAEKDLQTTGFNISPHYDYVRQSSSDLISGAEPIYPSGKRILSGYDITQTLTVKMRDMAKIGTIIQEVTAAGANQVGDLQFTLDDPDAAQAQAREKAINNAKEKANPLAKQLGVKLVKIVNYNENDYTPVYSLDYAAKTVAAGIAENAPAPSIQTGENKITSNVSIVYEIE